MNYIQITPPEFERIIDSRATKGYSERYTVQSSSCQIITDLYEIWHPYGIRYIPFEFLQKHFTAESLAWWYQDVGHLKKLGNTLKKIVLSTNSFSIEENHRLIHLLNEEFSLQFSLDAQNRLLLYDQLQINYFLMLVQPWMQSSLSRKNKTATQFKKIAKRTTVYLPSDIKLSKPTEAINKVVKRSFQEKNIQEFKKELPPLIERRTALLTTKAYQIEIHSQLHYPLMKIQAHTGLNISEIITLTFEFDEIDSPKKLKKLEDLSTVQQNILIASILGDGTLTKRSHHTRHKNSMYREHFSSKQLEYRKWKVNKMKPYFYLNNSQTEILSRTSLLFTDLEKALYPIQRIKRISLTILHKCTDPHFLATLYMDDGTLHISKYINHRLNKIYLTPTIGVYLQAFPKKDLELLLHHLKMEFNVSLRLAKRPDGYGYYIRTTKVEDTLHFLKIIEPVTKTCPSMAYKTNWNFRFPYEKEKLQKEYLEYEILSSQSNRQKNYSEQEIEQLIKLRKTGYTINEIASQIGRTYHSVNYKLAMLRRQRKK